MKDEPLTNSEAIRVDWEQLVQALFASLGIKEGLWIAGVGFTFTGLNAGPDRDRILPCGLVAVQDITLRRASAPGPMVFDAKTGKRVKFSEDAEPHARQASGGSAARKSKAARSPKKPAARKPTA